MSMQTKTYIPHWLWTELEKFVVHPQSKHSDTLFVIEKEGYDPSAYANFRLVKDDVVTRLHIGDKICLVHVLATDKQRKRSAKFGYWLRRLDTETLELLDWTYRVIDTYKISDIIRIRDSCTCRRIIIDDTAPLWTGKERFDNLGLRAGIIIL